jgi:hypothetical protein
VALLYSAITVVQYPFDVWLVSEQPREDIKMFGWLLLLHPYRFYLRLVQLWSFVLEILFWHSYTSVYLPKNVAEKAEKW